MMQSKSWKLNVYVVSARTVSYVGMCVGLAFRAESIGRRELTCIRGTARDRKDPHWAQLSALHCALTILSRPWRSISD